MPLKDGSHFRFFSTLMDREWKRRRHTGLTSSGFQSELRGMTAGIEVWGNPDLETGGARDSFAVFATGGSRADAPGLLLATVTDLGDGEVEIRLQCPDDFEVLDFVAEDGVHLVSFKHRFELTPL